MGYYFSLDCVSAADDDDVDIEYDADGNPIAPAKSKYIDPLPPIDHSKIEYKPFEKNFYNEHPDIAGLSPIQVCKLHVFFVITRLERLPLSSR